MPQLAHLDLRLAMEYDTPLLWHLFTSDRAADFAALGLQTEVLEALLAQQFHARQRGYADDYPCATDLILTLNEGRGDGTPVGRILFVQTQNQDQTSTPSSPSLRILDIAVLPDYRNQHFGTFALHQVQLLAARSSLPVTLRVLKSSSARRFYLRQGFTVAAQNDLAVDMQWSLNAHSAALHLSIHIHQLPHDNSYCGENAALRESLATDRGPDVPLLQDIGLTTSGLHENLGRYPYMLRWVRQASADEKTEKPLLAQPRVPPVDLYPIKKLGHAHRVSRSTHLHHETRPAHAWSSVFNPYVRRLDATVIEETL